MKIKSSVLFGLVVLICLVGGISLMNRMNDDQGGWRPADVYSTYGGSQGSTYSSVSYGSASSADLSVPMLSSSNSLFRHRGAFSYAPASGVSNGQLPMAGTASYSQSPIAYLLFLSFIRSFSVNKANEIKKKSFANIAKIVPRQVV